MREKKRKVHVNDRLSPNSLILVEKVKGDDVVFLRVYVRRNSSEHLWILSDPYKKSWHSQDENVMPIN